MRKTFASVKSLPENVALELASDDYEWTQVALAENEFCSNEVYNILSDSKFGVVHRALLKNPKISSSTIIWQNRIFS